MKKDKIIFWTTTGLIALMMLFSAFNYLTNEDMKNAFIHLGFPSYFRIELAIAKILGALVLVVPGIPRLVKQAAYVGLAIVFVSAIVAHASSGDPAGMVIAPAVALLMLAVSFAYFQKSAALAA